MKQCFKIRVFFAKIGITLNALLGPKPTAVSLPTAPVKEPALDGEPATNTRDDNIRNAQYRTG